MAAATSRTTISRPEAADRFPGDLGARKLRELPPERGLHRLRQFPTGRHQHRRRHGVVLGLGEEIGGDELGVGRFVGDDQDLTRAGKDVDAHRAGHDLLRQGHVTVARPDDHVDPRDRLGTIGQCRHGPGAARLVDLVHPGLPGRDEQVGVDPPVRRRRGHHDDLRNPGHPRRDRAHEHRGDQRRLTALAARHVDAHALDRPDELPEHRPRPVETDEGAPHLPAVKRLDLRRRPVERPGEAAIRGGGRLPEFHGADPQIPQSETGRIEAPTVLHEGLVAPPPHVCQDAADRGVIFFGKRKPARYDACDGALGGSRRIVQYLHGETLLDRLCITVKRRFLSN